MKVTQIKIKNFKGIKRLSIALKMITNIFGKNGIGKSTVMDAYLYCMTLKNAAGESQFKITPQDGLGCNIEGLENDITTVIDHNGESIPLRVVRKEKMSKLRGSNDKVVSGYDNFYYVDGVPKKKSEYMSFISSIVNPDKFAMLSNPLHFPSLEWKLQRSMLVDLASIKSDIDIAEGMRSGDKNINKVIWLIQKEKSLDDQKMRIESEIKVLEDDIKDIPTRIDQNNSMKPEPIDVDKVKAEIFKLNEELEGIDKSINSLYEKYKVEEKANSLISDNITQNRTRLTRLEGELMEIANKSTLVASNKKYKLESSKNDIENSMRRIDKDIKDKEELLKYHDSEYKKACDDWEVSDSSKFEVDENALKCPTCKRDFDDSENRYEELEKNFNLNKAQTIEEINTRGKNSSDSMKKLNEEITNLKTSKIKINADILKISNEIDSIIIPKASDIDLSSNPISIEIESVKETIKGLVSELESTKPDIIVDDETTARKTELKAQITELNKSLGVIEQIEKYNTNNNDLLKQQSEASIKIVDLKGELSAITKFQKVKMSLVEESVNSEFEIVKFRLWEIYNNGNDKECCTILLNGVPFSDLSTAQKTHAGLDIIKRLQVEANVELPLFIDNRESVIDIPDMPNQIINMIVDKDCLELKID